jgi:hypothetical protein
MRGQRSAVRRIFHFPFSIFHLSFVFPALADSPKLCQMTNLKWKMENGKWKTLLTADL